MLNKKFMWGGSVSSMQTEGAWNVDGKGPSVYDERPIKEGHSNWKDGIDFYHTYKEDIKLFKELGLNSYRFSISWARVLPEGENDVNKKGLQFYHQMIDELINHGIEPIICIYHFDLPQALREKYGGWQNKELLQAWKELVDVLVSNFGSKVKYWIPFNEQNITLIGLDFFNPEFKNLTDIEKNKLSFDIWHNCNVAGAYLRKVLKHNNINAQAGGMINYSTIYAEDSHPQAVLNAATLNDALNHATLEVMVHGRYPKFITNAWTGIEPEILADELELIRDFPVDFIGFSYYVSRVVSAKQVLKPLPTDLSQFVMSMMTGDMEKNPYLEQSEWGWTIDDIGLRIALKDLESRYHLPIFIMECGIGVKEQLNESNTVDDTYRMEYFSKHIQAVNQAVSEDGVDCIGFLTWGPIDILSSQGEMKKRYGFIYVNRDETDLLDMKRYKKKSFSWFRKVIDSNGEDLEIN